MGRVEALGHSGQLWHGWPTHSSTRPLRPLHAVPQILAPGCVPDPDAPFRIPRPALRPLPSPPRCPPPPPPRRPPLFCSLLGFDAGASGFLHLVSSPLSAGGIHGVNYEHCAESYWHIFHYPRQPVSGDGGLRCSPPLS